MHGLSSMAWRILHAVNTYTHISGSTVAQALFYFSHWSMTLSVSDSQDREVINLPRDLMRILEEGEVPFSTTGPLVERGLIIISLVPLKETCYFQVPRKRHLGDLNSCAFSVNVGLCVFLSVCVCVCVCLCVLFVSSLESKYWPRLMNDKLQIPRSLYDISIGPLRSNAEIAGP